MQSNFSNEEKFFYRDVRMIHHTSVPGKSRTRRHCEGEKGGSIHHTFNMEAERIACYTRFSLFSHFTPTSRPFVTAKGERSVRSEILSIFWHRRPRRMKTFLSLILLRRFDLSSCRCVNAKSIKSFVISWLIALVFPTARRMRQKIT